MTNPEVAILMLCLFIVLVLLGFPIAFTLIAMGVGFRLLRLLPGPRKFWGSIQQPDLLPAEPKHLLGDGKRHTGRNPAVPVHGLRRRTCRYRRQAVRSLQMAAHNLPGSMAIAALVTCAVFSTASGIVGAVVTLMGLLAYPAMANANYDKKFAAGVICAGGTLQDLDPSIDYADRICGNCRAVSASALCSSNVPRTVAGRFIYCPRDHPGDDQPFYRAKARQRNDPTGH